MRQDLVDLNIDVNPKQYNFLLNSTKRKNHEYGSAGSGKSWSIAQYLIVEKMFGEHDIRIIVTRKTGPALSKSAWLLVQDLLKKYELPYDINKTERAIFIGTNEMYFVALDDPQKLKSFEKINYVWAEEATELFKEDFIQLGLRCRGDNPNGANALYFSYNPDLKPWNEYLRDITTNPPNDTAVLHTTYKDNCFLTDEYIKEIESLKTQDETYWKVYGLGEWAMAKNIVYTNWDVIPTNEWPTDSKNVGYGLDFGYNEPTALIKIDIRDGEIFEEELLYERKMTNTELIEAMNTLITDRRRVIVADCAQPERIEEIRMAGFNIFPCSKGKSSIKIGIDRVKRFKVHIRSTSINLIEEKVNYKWKEDYNGNPLDSVVDYKNHLIDAERYYIGELKYDGMPELLIIGDYF